MKTNKYTFRIAALSSVFALGIGLLVNISKPSTEVDAYSESSLPTTIDLNDCTEQVVRDYYSGLNSLDVSERQGTNLLKNLKPILKNGQQYFSYDTSNNNKIWQIYEISDRDWEKSQATSISHGTYNPTTNKITNYTYGSNGDNPYLHALYVDRDIDNLTRAWSGHTNETKWGMNREHIWAKSHGFQANGQGGARGDLIHLWASNAYANGIHSNNFYGFVDTTRTYTDCGDHFDNIYNNLSGYSRTVGGNQTIFEPQDCDKGDIARSIFYMAARYNNYSGSDSDGFGTNNPNLVLANNLSENNTTGTSTANQPFAMGLLSDLLAWNKLDPVDEYEIHRNNLLYNNYTKNRNPFIDFPNWADAIWGTADLDGTHYNSTITTYATPASDQLGSATITPVFGISNTQLNLEVGQTATISGRNAESSITWTVANSAVASLNKTTTTNNENVTVTALSAGTTTITATSSGNSATCSITVSETGGQGETGTLFTADLTDTAAVNNGYTITFGNASDKTGYYQDGSTVGNQTYFKVMSTSRLFTSEPDTIEFTANLGSGNNVDDLTNNVEVCLVDQSGNDISSTRRTLTSSISTTTREYSVELPYSADAYGVKLYHVKTSGYNIRFFSFSLSCESSTPVGPQPRDYLNNTAEVFYLTADEGPSETSSSMDYIIFSLEGLSNGVQYSDPFEIAEGVTITFSGGANDGKYYNTGRGIRTYGSGSITVECDEGITQIVYTWDDSSSDYVPDDDYSNVGTYDTSTYTWTGSATSVTLTRPSGTGHWRLKAVEVTYDKPSVSVSNVKMRFGAAIPVDDWYDIEASWDVDYYGVMFLKYDTLHTTYGYSSIEDAYEDGIRPRADVHTNEGDMPLPLNGLLIFTAGIKMTDELNYGVVYVAAPYIVIDGTHYFLEEMEYSVNSMAQEYLDNDLDSTLSDAALRKLATPVSQGD